MFYLREWGRFAGVNIVMSRERRWPETRRRVLNMAMNGNE
jgi:hypothetical protein